jgi:hypothetical protein
MGKQRGRACGRGNRRHRARFSHPLLCHGGTVPAGASDAVKRQK